MTLTLQTQGSDPARPQETGPVPAVDPQAIPLAPAAEPTDPDEIELRAALAAVQTEEAASQAAPTDPAAPLAKEPPPTRHTVPKARLDEALNRADRAAEAATKAQQEAAYYKGMAEARAATQQPAQPQPQRQQLTPEQGLAEIARRQDVLAKQFDDGQISMSDLTKAQRQLAQYEHNIREAQLAAKVKPAQQPAPAPQQGNDELYLETLTADLENAHPWVQVLEQVGKPSDWEYLKRTAIENLTEQGLDPGAGALGKYNLRKEMARLADQLGPALIGPRAQAKGIVLPGQSVAAGTQPQQRPLSPQAQARQAKLALAASAPPSLANLAGSTGTQGYTPAQIDALTEAEYDSLPATVRSKLRGAA